MADDPTTAAATELDFLRRQLARIHELTDLLRLRRDPMDGHTLAHLIDRWLLEAVTDLAPLPHTVENTKLRLATEIVSDGHRLADRMAQDENAESYANELRSVLFPWSAVTAPEVDRG